MGTYLFRVARSGEGSARKEFKLTLDNRMTVLDGLFEIQKREDPSLSFRCSCRVGMCGSCAMVVNYQPRLACQTRVETLDSDVITVQPLHNLPVAKDLVVSLEPFFEKWKEINPALDPINKGSKKLAVIPPDSDFGKEAAAKRDCITCGACYSACSLPGSNKGYLGPAAINKALLRLLDPRDKDVKHRLEVLYDTAGIWRCHTQFNCTAACPKGIPLTDSIMRLKRAMIRPGQFNDNKHSTTSGS